MEGLRIERAAIVGHHSGANIALELCLQRTDLVRSVVLSGLFYVADAAQLRELREKTLKFRDPEAKADGSHLPVLWAEGLRTNWGKPRLPPERIDLLTDFFLEQMKSGPRRFEPYVAQMAYSTHERLPRLAAPCLFIKATDDVFMCAASNLWHRDKPRAKLSEIAVSGGGEMPRLYASAWSAAILDFLA